MKIEANEIQINGVVYVPKSENNNNEIAKQVDGLDYVLIRADRAGVFTGYLESKNNGTVVLRQARRIWYWDGASSISQLATDGTSKPQNCKFPTPVSRLEISGVIEILEVTEKAKKSIEAVAIWKQ